MASPTVVYSSDKVSLWLQRTPASALEFLGCHDVADLTIPRGDISTSRKRVGKGKFKTIQSRQGTPEAPTVTFSFYRETANLLSDLPCPSNVLVFYSNCGADDDPDNYDFIDYLAGVNISESSQTAVVNAIAPDDAGDVGADIIVELSAQLDEVFTIKNLSDTALTVAALSGRIIDDVSICDPDPECPNGCSSSTDGCQTIWIITRGSPGFYGAARIYKSTDGGSTWVEQTNSMTIDTDTLSAVGCDGDVVIITNEDTGEYQVSNDGGTTWTLVTGLANPANDVSVIGQTRIWLCGDGGYIWYSNTKGISVTVQDAGVATVENLNSISFSDDQVGYAVGVNNAFVRTTDGGSTWSAVTGPAVGIALNAVEAVLDSDTVYVGDASGEVHRSIDKGDTWTTVITGFTPLAGGITDIAISEQNIVLVSGNNSDGLGAVYQSIDGGNSWTVQGTPADVADSINAIATCDPNTYYGVGDAGLIFKLAGESFRDTA